MVRYCKRVRIRSLYPPYILSICPAYHFPMVISCPSWCSPDLRFVQTPRVSLGVYLQTRQIDFTFSCRFLGTNLPLSTLDNVVGQLTLRTACTWDRLRTRRGAGIFPCNCPFCKLTAVTFSQIPVMYSDKLNRICKRRMPCLSSSNGSSPPSSPGLHGWLRDIPSNISDRIRRSASG